MRLRHLHYVCACLFLAGTRGYITTKADVLEEEVSKRNTVDNIIASLEAAQQSVDSSSLTELEQRSARAALRPVLAEALRAAAELERIAAGPEPGSSADPELKQQLSDGEPTQALRWASLNGTSPDDEARQDILRASDDLVHASEIMRASDEAAGSSDGAEAKGDATGKTGSEGEGEPPYAIFLELGENSALASLAPPSMPSPPPTGVPVIMPSVAAEAASAASGIAAEEEVSGGSVADVASADVASGALEVSSGEAAFVGSAFVESASVEASSGAPLPSPDASPEPSPKVPTMPIDVLETQSH